jgi:hypothetical protein
MSPYPIIMGLILAIALTLALRVIISDWVNTRKDRRNSLRIDHR